MSNNNAQQIALVALMVFAVMVIVYHQCETLRNNEKLTSNTALVWTKLGVPLSNSVAEYPYNGTILSEGLVDACGNQYNPPIMESGYKFIGNYTPIGDVREPMPILSASETAFGVPLENFQCSQMNQTTTYPNTWFG
jgi:hypothetical protein